MVQQRAAPLASRGLAAIPAPGFHLRVEPASSFEESVMRSSRTAAVLAILVLASSPCLAQSDPSMAQPRRRQPTAVDSAPVTGAPVDLDATRKRFDANAAKTADRDRKRDAKLKQSMGSICAGCEAAPSARRTRAKQSMPDPTAAEDQTSPAD